MKNKRFTPLTEADIHNGILDSIHDRKWTREMFLWLCSAKNLHLAKRLMFGQAHAEYTPDSWETDSNLILTARDIAQFDIACEHAHYSRQDVKHLLQVGGHSQMLQAAAAGCATIIEETPAVDTDVPPSWDTFLDLTIKHHIGRGIVPITTSTFELRPLHPDTYTIHMTELDEVDPEYKTENIEAVLSFNRFLHYKKDIIADGRVGEYMYLEGLFPEEWEIYHLIFPNTRITDDRGRLLYYGLAYDTRLGWEEHLQEPYQFLPQEYPDERRLNENVRIVCYVR